MLKRAPRFLRVVEHLGKWDALDQLTDVPKIHERLFAYRIKGKPSAVHIKGSRGVTGWYAFAIYRFCPTQPSDQEMRSTDGWRAWCRAADQTADLPMQ